MVATGGVQPYTWSATGINPRSSINPSTGLISWLAQAGTWTVTVTARDTAGVSGSTTFRIRVARECRTC